MDDPVTVGGVERCTRLLEPEECFAGARRTCPLQLILERSAAQVLHDDERALVPFPDVEDRDRVRLAGELCRSERLTLEARPDRGVAGIPLGQQLDRDGTPENVVLGAKDLAHAALADAFWPEVAGRKLALFVGHEEDAVGPPTVGFPAGSPGKRAA